MRQKDQVLKHMLRSGSISSFEAIMDYGITRLAARIGDLKKDGYIIDAQRKKNPVTGKQYVRYSVSEQS